MIFQGRRTTTVPWPKFLLHPDYQDVRSSPDDIDRVWGFQPHTPPTPYPTSSTSPEPAWNTTPPVRFTELIVDPITRPHYPEIIGDHVTRPHYPDIIAKNATRPHYPEIIGDHETRSHYPEIIGDHVIRSHYSEHSVYPVTKPSNLGRKFTPVPNTPYPRRRVELGTRQTHLGRRVTPKTRTSFPEAVIKHSNPGHRVNSLNKWNPVTRQTYTGREVNPVTGPDFPDLVSSPNYPDPMSRAANPENKLHPEVEPLNLQQMMDSVSKQTNRKWKVNPVTDSSSSNPIINTAKRRVDPVANLDKQDSTIELDNPDIIESPSKFNLEQTVDPVNAVRPQDLAVTETNPEQIKDPAAAPTNPEQIEDPGAAPTNPEKIEDSEAVQTNLERPKDLAASQTYQEQQEDLPADQSHPEKLLKPVTVRSFSDHDQITEQTFRRYELPNIQPEKDSRQQTSR